MRKRIAAKPSLSFIEPMQPALVDAPPDGSDWVHEVKWDGYRSQVIVQNGRCPDLHPPRPRLDEALCADRR